MSGSQEEHSSFMPGWQPKQPVVVVSACMRSDGTPDFALNVVEVTSDERDNGIHYYLAEADLVLAGFEEPFVHFSEGEGPDFLHRAVRQYLGLPDVIIIQTPNALAEKR